MTILTRQRWVILSTVILLLIAIPTFAAKGVKANKANNGHGKVTAVSATSITVTPKTGEAKTYTVSAATTVTLDGKAAKIADVQVGQNAKVTSADGKAATTITAKARVKKAKKIAVPVTSPAAPSAAQ